MNSKTVASIINKAKKLVELEKKRSRPFKPVIISDIDGVLVRGNNPIPQTLQAMQKIHDFKIPFACLTNGGGQLQIIKAQKLNKSFNKKLFDGTFMFMNHTPLKPELIRHSKRPGNLLVSGSLNILQILRDLKITNFITADQIYAIYFSELQEENKDLSQKIWHFYERSLKKQEALRQAQKRIDRKLKSFGEEAALINSIFALNDVSPYETTLTVIHNILKNKQENNSQNIQYYAAQNDIVWAGGYHKPRLAFGPFNYILVEHCKKHKFNLIEHIYYGKPQQKAFKFVQQQMKKREPNGVFFMMGDNPRADIKGANTVGWYSFLTRTGIHQGQENDANNPATFVVNNFSEAVQIILQASKYLQQ